MTELTGKLWLYDRPWEYVTFAADGAFAPSETPSPPLLAMNPRLLAAASASLLVLHVHADLPITPLAVPGQPAPVGVSGVTYSTLLNAGGSPDPDRFAFSALLEGAGVGGDTDIAGFAGVPGVVGMVSREGSPPDFGSGGGFILIGSPSINAAGTVLTYGTLTAANPYFGFYRRSASGVFETLATTGSPIAGETSLFLGPYYYYGNACAIDGAGRVVFTADLTGSNVNNTNLYGLFRAAPGNIVMLARRGTGTPPGIADSNVTYSIFQYPTTNASGQVAFRASLNNAPPSSNEGIWATRNGVLTLIIRKGDPAPGVSKAAILEFNGSVGLGDDGTVGFGATLSGIAVTANNDRSLWKASPTGFRLLVREGQQAPELATGVVFDDFPESSTDAAPSINPYGNAAFSARVRGPGITDANNDTLWVEDGNGELRLLAREGGPSDGAGGAPFGVNAIHTFSPFSLRPVNGFASTTRVIFSASTDGGNSSGIFAAEVPDDSIAPVIRISGAKSRKTKRPTARITGTASDNRRVTRVETRVLPQAYRPASGTTRWTVNARLKKGRKNTFIARARDAAGNVSRPATISIRRT